MSTLSLASSVSSIVGAILCGFLVPPSSSASQDAPDALPHNLNRWLTKEDNRLLMQLLKVHPYALPPLVLAAAAVPLFAVAAAVLLHPDEEQRLMCAKQQQQQQEEEDSEEGSLRGGGDSKTYGSVGVDGVGGEGEEEEEEAGMMKKKAEQEREQGVGGGGGGGDVAGVSRKATGGAGGSMSKSDVAILALMSGLLAASMLAFDEVWTLLMVTDEREGGLHLDTRNASVSFVIGRAAMIASQLAVWPWAERTYGPLASHRVALAASAVFYAATPLVPSQAAATGGTGLGVGALRVVLACQYAVMTVGQTSLFLLITRASEVSEVGAVTGVTGAGVSVGLMLAPLIATNTLAWSLHNGADPFPFGRCAAFLLFAAVVIPLALGASFLLSARVRARVANRR